MIIQQSRRYSNYKSCCTFGTIFFCTKQNGRENAAFIRSYFLKPVFCSKIYISFSQELTYN